MLAHGRFDNTVWVAFLLNVLFFFAWVYGTHHFFNWDMGVTGIFFLAGSHYWHMAQE